MTSAIERAARAVYAVELARDENANSLIIRMGGNPHPSTRIEAFEESPVQWGEYASAAITAFLSEDEEMVERVARGMYDHTRSDPRFSDRVDYAANPGAQDYWPWFARAAIAALREMATQAKE